MKTEQSKILLSPTDLANHIACRYLTNLELKAANGDLHYPWLNSNICLYKSEVFYENRLRSQKGMEHRKLKGITPIYKR